MNGALKESIVRISNENVNRQIEASELKLEKLKAQLFKKAECGFKSLVFITGADLYSFDIISEFLYKEQFKYDAYQSITPEGKNIFRFEIRW